MEVIIPERLDDTYARAPMPGAEPEKPEADNYQMGVEPLDTCPASWWNWFMQTLFQHGALTTDALQVIYTELTAVLRAGNDGF
jgi:hypothetical protein